MPYTIVPHGDGFALKKADGSLHKSGSTVVVYATRAKAIGAAHYIALSERGEEPNWKGAERRKGERRKSKHS